MIASVDIGELQQNIIDAIRADFDYDFKVVDDYPEDRLRCKTPACLIQLLDWEIADGEDPGTDQLPLRINFEAIIALGTRTPTVKREIRVVSANLCRFLAKDMKPVGTVGRAQVNSAGPDGLNPDIKNFEIWSVEFSLLAYVGKSIYPGTGVQPGEILIGYSPNTGHGNEDDYEPLGS